MATWDELTAIRPGAKVRVEGDGFLLERTIRFEQDGDVWFEHRLSSDRSGRYHEDARDDRRVTYENLGDAVREVSEGRAIGPAGIEILG